MNFSLETIAKRPHFESHRLDKLVLGNPCAWGDNAVDRAEGNLTGAVVIKVKATNALRANLLPR